MACKNINIIWIILSYLLLFYSEYGNMISLILERDVVGQGHTESITMSINETLVPLLSTLVFWGLTQLVFPILFSLLWLCPGCEMIVSSLNCAVYCREVLLSILLEYFIHKSGFCLQLLINNVYITMVQVTVAVLRSNTYHVNKKKPFCLQINGGST